LYNIYKMNQQYKLDELHVAQWQQPTKQQDLQINIKKQKTQKFTKKEHEEKTKPK
jgi:hypothetical protein